MCATFFHLQPVRELWYIIERIIPKNVLPASAHPQEKWKLAMTLGDLDLTKFNIDNFASSVIGYKVEADDLQVSSLISRKYGFERYLGLQKKNLIDLVLGDISHILLTDETPVIANRVWFSKSFTVKDVELDIEWCLSNKIDELLFETPDLLREMLKKSGLVHLIKCRWMSLKSFLATTSGDCHVYMAPKDKDECEILVNKSVKELHYMGLRSQGVKKYYLERTYDVMTDNTLVDKVIETSLITDVNIFLSSFVLNPVNMMILSGSLFGVSVLGVGMGILYLVTKKKERNSHNYTHSRGHMMSSFHPIINLKELVPCDLGFFSNPSINNGIKRIPNGGLHFLDDEDTHFLYIEVPNNELKEKTLKYVIYEPESLLFHEVVDKIMEDNVEILRSSIRKKNDEFVFSKKKKEQKITLFKGNGFEKLCKEQKLFPSHILINMSDKPVLIPGVLNMYGKNVDYICPTNLDVLFTLDLNLALSKGKVRELIKIEKNDVFFRGSNTGKIGGIRYQLIGKINSSGNLKNSYDCGLTKTREYYEYEDGKLSFIKLMGSPKLQVPKRSFFKHKFILVLPGHHGCGYIMELISQNSLPLIALGDYNKSYVQSRLEELIPEIFFDGSLSSLEKLVTKLSGDDELFDEINERKKIALNLLRVEIQEWFLHYTCNLEDTRINLEKVEREISWNNNLIGHKMIMRDVSDKAVVHGILLDGNSPGVKLHMTSGDHGCGASVFLCNVTEQEVLLKCSEVPTGANKWENISTDVIKGVLNYFEIAGVEPRILNVLKSERGEELLLNNLCSLGGGNHYIEINSFNERTYVTVHCGSRGMKTGILKLLKIDFDREVKGNTDILFFCEKFGILNRRLINGFLSCRQLVDTLYDRGLIEQNHSEMVKSNEYFPGVSLGITKNLCASSYVKKTLLLGNSSCGNAIMNTEHDLIPHGTGSSLNSTGDLGIFKDCDRDSIFTPIVTFSRHRNGGGHGTLFFGKNL